MVEFFSFLIVRVKYQQNWISRSKRHFFLALSHRHTIRRDIQVNCRLHLNGPPCIYNAFQCLAPDTMQRVRITNQRLESAKKISKTRGLNLGGQNRANFLARVTNLRKDGERFRLGLPRGWQAAQQIRYRVKNTPLAISPVNGFQQPFAHFWLPRREIWTTMETGFHGVRDPMFLLNIYTFLSLFLSRTYIHALPRSTWLRVLVVLFRASEANRVEQKCANLRHWCQCSFDRACARAASVTPFSSALVTRKACPPRAYARRKLGVRRSSTMVYD